MQEKCVLSATEIASGAGAQPDVIGWLPGSKGTVLFECKVNPADFRSDFSKSQRIYPSQGIGRYRYYLAPKGVIDIEQLPENWGLIEINVDGKHEIILKAKSQHCNLIAERQLMLSVIRRIGGISESQGIAVKEYPAKENSRTDIAIRKAG